MAASFARHSVRTTSWCRTSHASIYSCLHVCHAKQALVRGTQPWPLHHHCCTTVAAMHASPGESGQLGPKLLPGLSPLCPCCCWLWVGVSASEWRGLPCSLRLKCFSRPFCCVRMEVLGEAGAWLLERIGIRAPGTKGRLGLRRWWGEVLRELPPDLGCTRMKTAVMSDVKHVIASYGHEDIMHRVMVIMQAAGVLVGNQRMVRTLVCGTLVPSASCSCSSAAL